jgi:hypothetical protein
MVASIAVNGMGRILIVDWATGSSPASLEPPSPFSRELAVDGHALDRSDEASA